MNVNAKYELLKTIVGSHAHGLATPESDIDYRGVFITPTSKLLALGPKPHTSSWIEGTEDHTSYEIGHFLFLATKSNPSILEVFRSPVQSTGYVPIWQLRLLDLFPYVWSSIGVYDAFRGYGRNQRTKMIDNKDHRYHKYAVAWLRTLYNATELLRTGDFSMSVVNTPVEHVLRRWKAAKSAIGDPGQILTAGEVVDTCALWEESVTMAYEANQHKETDVGPVNEYLLDLRKAFWV